MDSMKVIKRNGSTEALNVQKIHDATKYATNDLNASQSELETAAHLMLFDGIRTSDIQKALIVSAAGLISEESPDYTYAAARLLLQTLYKEVTGGTIIYPSLRSYIERGISEGILDPRLATDFDLEHLDTLIDPELDFKFDYLGLQTLADRYFVKERPAAGRKSKIIELPQHFWMRVAMGVALAEKENKTAWAGEFYLTMANFWLVPSTPTLFNAGTNHPQLSSCYGNTVEDSIDGIFQTMHECARFSKYAGGIGTDWTRVRSAGSPVLGTSGKSSGVVPYLKVFNDTAVAVNQAGKRNGAFAAYLEPWHPDFLDFIDLKKNSGDERRRAHDIYPAAWIPDLFIKRVENDEMWSFISPADVPELHEAYGHEFESLYSHIESDKPHLIRSQMPAKDLWRKMLTSLFETGHPWITFKDTHNNRNPQSHAGVIHNTNLCCMTGDQRVVTDAGIMTVKELYDSQRKNKVVGLTEFSDASEMLLPRPNAPIVEIQTAEGYSHKVTPDHRVWVKDKGWVEAQHLISGDKLLTQQIEGMFGEVHQPKLALVAGLIAGDGTYLDKGNSASVCIDLRGDKTGKFRDIIERVVEEVIIDDYAVTTSSLSPEFNESKSKDKWRLCSAPLARVLNSFGFNKDAKLKVPDFVWKGTKPTVMGYLRGLYLTDGNIQVGKDATTMVLSSVDREFLKDIQILWANFGVKTSISKMHDGGLTDFNDGYGEYECKPCWRLLITSIQGCQIAERVTMLGKFRTGDSADTFVSNLKKKGYKQKLYATFTSLVDLPNEDAYCLTVDSETHAWTVNGLVTHNTEISLNNSDLETFVCNLGSINLSKLTAETYRDTLAEVVPVAVRMLDNVIDVNFYPSEKARASNMKSRPIGLGMMGYTELLVKSGIDWESEEHLEFAEELSSCFAYYATKASCDLAKERGAYASFAGSKWDRGILPIDSAVSLTEIIGQDYCESLRQTGQSNSWLGLRKSIRENGMRNCNVTAIAPTATIANIVGTTPCIEPIYERVTEKKNLSGPFTVVDPCLRHNKSRRLCKESFDIDQTWVIRAAAIRQRWIDQSQSINLFVDNTINGRKLSELYMLAWKLGLKSTYYLKSRSSKFVSKPESDLTMMKLPEQEVESDLESIVKVCSIDNPDCESCQ
ncbi:MAG: ribonucleoside-diphosphate reductase [Methylomicrobium sp.]|nr:ribonucleoside-diphosphate reductase [Methylomicrobium sp.]